MRWGHVDAGPRLAATWRYLRQVGRPPGNRKAHVLGSPPCSYFVLYACNTICLRLRILVELSLMAPFRPFKIFTPSPILGYGYDVDEFCATVINEKPEAIILDAG